MKPHLKKHRWLVLILLIAAILRIFNLASNPPALYWDEASIGYNAFAIMTQGVDEHGVAWPITHFLAYGDAKPPGYIYAVSLFMSLVGVNEWAIRLPSALAGIVSVGLTYLISQLFFNKFKTQTRQQISLWASLLLAISPWAIQMSRGGFEANLALTFFLLGLWAGLKVVRDQKPKYLLLTSSAWVLTWYIFNAYRLFIPPLAVAILVLYFRDLFKYWRWLLASIILALALSAPLIPFVLSDQAKLRFEEVSIFYDLDPVVDANSTIDGYDNQFWARLMFNRRWWYAREFLDGMFDHLKGEYLFISGDINPRLGVRDMGVLYIWDLPWLLLGIYILIGSKLKSRDKILVLVWLILALVPGAVARETPHALRTLQVLPLPQLVMALGLARLTNKSKFWLTLVIIGYLASAAWYTNLYHRHYRDWWASSWQYGYKQLVNYLDQVEDEYQAIVVTESVGRPHTYILFYQQIDPKQYLETRDAGIDDFGFTYTNSFGKYYFGDNRPDDDLDSVLYVGDGSTQVDSERVVYTIKNPRNETVFVVYQ